MLSRYQHVVDELRRDAADRMGQALWPEEKLRLTETRTETKDQHRRTRKASDPEHQVRGLVVEPPVGVEPTTYALRVRRSSRLS
jgi:hypothetical protein